MYTEYMYKDSLAHHGIEGQKWGVRRYQNSDGSYTAEGRARYGVGSKRDKRLEKSQLKYEAKRDKHLAKINTSKTRLGKGYHNYAAYDADYEARRKKALREGKGAKYYLSNTVGRGARINLYGADKDYFDRQYEYRKSKRGRAHSKSNAYNSKAWEDYNKDVANAKRKGEKHSRKFMKTQLKSWSGRDTTMGKTFAGAMVPHLTLARDEIYYQKHKNEYARKKK